MTVADGYKACADGYVYAYVSPGQVVEVRHADNTTKTYEFLEDAFAEAKDGDLISLLDDVNTYASIMLGTQSVNGTPKSLTLDLDGHSITSKWGVAHTFTVYHGALVVKNSVPGEGGIDNTAVDGNVFRLYGSYLKNCNPRIHTPFTHLTIEEGVDIFAQNSEGSGISVTEMRDSYQAVCGTDYTTDVYNNTTEKGKLNGYGVANGIRVDIKGNIHANKYGLKVNGSIRYPDVALYGAEGSTDAAAIRAEKAWFAGYEVLESDTAYAPYLHVYSSAVIESAANTNQSTAAYASGYARWLIEGTCQGANGLYIKSGEVTLNNAIIESTTTGDAQTIITGKSAGIEGSGNAVTIESNRNYSGESVLTINGDTKLSTEANGGAALVDVVDATHESKVEGIEINGGTFTGDQAIIISNETATSETNQILINGVLVVGDITIGGETDTTAVSSIKGQQTHITAFDNADDTRTVIVSIGVAPAAATEWTDVAALAEGSNAKWTGFTAGVIATGESVKLGELQIISGNSTDGVQQLTVDSGAQLIVDKLIMNDYARIIVEAGGQLIVTGEQGINAPNVANILLKTSETAQAIFLFHPNVTSNRHPNATVEFTSKSYRQSGKNVYQRFGIPSYTNDVRMEYKDPSSSTLTYIQMWDYAADKWTELWIAVPAATGLNVGVSGPFGCFDLASNNAKESPMTYLFKGALVGNNDASMTFNNKFNPYANSYMAPIDIKTLVNRLADNYPELSAAVYVYVALANDNYTWLPLAQSDFTGWDVPAVTKIDPMQAYMLYMIPGNTSNATVSYKDNVYDPFMTNGSNPAPAHRAKAAKKNFLKLNIADESGVVFDNARILEDNQFGEEFDNGYDVNKYMNEKVNLYVMSQDEAWSTVASDDVLNKYIGVNVAQSGVYTISVAHNGLDYALVDLENNQVIDLVEGNTYSFFQEAGKNDARFQVVKVSKVTTALEDVQNDVLSTKFMKDGVLYIIKNGVVYNAQGQIVK